MKQSNISDRYNFSQLCELASIGEAIKERLPNLVPMLMAPVKKSRGPRKHREPKSALGPQGDLNGPEKKNADSQIVG